MTKHRATTEEEPGRILAAMADLNAQAAAVSARLPPMSLLSLSCSAKWPNSLFACARLLSSRHQCRHRLLPGCCEWPTLYDVLVSVNLLFGGWCKRRRFPLRGDSARGPSRGLRMILPTGYSIDRCRDEQPTSTLQDAASHLLRNAEVHRLRCRTDASAEPHCAAGFGRAM
jgi:hypothetical protein